MCFGFLGIQFGFALQNANVSRIFQTLGAEIDDLPILWVAAPVTGLLVQPIIGYMSDRTWTGLGRRRPYFLVGAILASLALFVMPNSPYLWVAAGMLWVMDASINVSMEPFRAFVGDNLPQKQRTLGFAMQSFFIGLGAIVASALPWMMANWFEVSNVAGPGQIPDTVKWSFYLGGVVFLAAVSWTVFTTQEYSPEELTAFAEAEEAVSGPSPDPTPRAPGKLRNGGLAWIATGAALLVWIEASSLDKQLYILAIGAIAFGLLQIVTGGLEKHGRTENAVFRIVDDLFRMPRVMKQLAVVQFFSWFALFAMWIYSTAAVTSHHYAAMDASGQAYNEGANWVGILFAAYNGFAALAALVIPWMARRFGCRMSHLVNLCIGGLGLLSFIFIHDPAWLLLPMVGVGIAWASILSLPYALLSDVLPPAKMGIYMGIFNFFIVIPQLAAASVLGLMLREFFDGQAIYGLVIGGMLMVLAGFTTLLVDREAEPAT
ncbi:MAG: MFS transporter [Xanthomonadales bacterium]|nr:MFS transporter [Gammaproteobacteria bacterium]MBT8050829.1 MFS transporter [Gammaproteobacteria bacterium]MBT8056012.1 MFS transporter [Gammaproteobacteria bacterium]NNJ78420.1 MFS transporter [Xanthomonadales bacterium]NNL03831.1 MFS transporter [Xanthomonadales bacterium]